LAEFKVAFTYNFKVNITRFEFLKLNRYKMKRYIEIVYDNSGSMGYTVAGKKKYEIAQELFEKDILPTIGLRGDHVVLRILRKGCQGAISNAEILPNQRNIMLDKIKGINHDQDTPLFYTVFDAVEACRNFKADEYLIFVLTDGDDTCGVKIEDLVGYDTLKKYVRDYNGKFLLVQLAIDSLISRNNLTALTSAIGGQVISLDSADSIADMRKKLKTALNVSGFVNKFPLVHCFDKLPGFDLAWEEIEEGEIDFHQAMLLHQKGLLTWLPDYNLGVSSLQYAELRFLYSLLFKSGIPEDLVKTMLSQLKKPYYYSFDCIYWDFASARWRFFIPQNQVQQLPNEEAKFEDFPSVNKMNDFDRDNTKYIESITYRVESELSIRSTFQLLSDNNKPVLNKVNKIIVLKEGDRVLFRS